MVLRCVCFCAFETTHRLAMMSPCVHRALQSALVLHLMPASLDRISLKVDEMYRHINKGLG